jgi:hypothetical protein
MPKRMSTPMKGAIMSALALTQVLASVPDPRSRHGRRHPLPAVLSLVTLALLMGKRSLEAIAQLGRDYGPPLAHALGFTRGKTPTKSTLSELLRAIAPQALEDALTRWIASRLPDGVEVFSLDGKTLRGSRDGEVPGHHLVCAYAPQVEAVLAQMRVDAKTNEHKAALQLLGILPLRGRVVLGDALFCQRDLCQKVIDNGGDYVLMVKDNQPGLATDIAGGFGYEAAARSIAAAFSPHGGGTSRAAGADRRDHRQGARTDRETDPPHDVAVDLASTLAGVETGV